MANLALSPRRYARLAKRAIRLARGQDVRYRMDLKPPRKHIGSLYGGWVINPELLRTDSVVLSFGVGDDISFDLELIKRFGVRVHGFDPSPNVNEWLGQQRLPANYVFRPWGLGAEDGELSFYALSDGKMWSLHREHISGDALESRVSVRRLSTIIKELGITKIDLLKMDIEGTEYDIIDDLIGSDTPIKQMLIEFHHRIGVRPLSVTVESVNRLRRAGFQLFNVSETSSEFSFLHV